MHALENTLRGYTIEPMAVGDVDAVLDIERASFTNPWKRSMFESELRNPVSFAYTLKRSFGAEEKIVAYIIFWVVQGEAHILDLAVDPQCRRLGLGETLLAAALDMMRTRLVFEVFLEVRRSNTPAITLYRKLGFTESFVRRNYYGDEDALVMTLVMH